MWLPTITPVAPSLTEGIGDLAVQPRGPPDRIGLQPSAKASRWALAMASTTSRLLMVGFIPTLSASAEWAAAFVILPGSRLTLESLYLPSTAMFGNVKDWSWACITGRRIPGRDPRGSDPLSSSGNCDRSRRIAAAVRCPGSPGEDRAAAPDCAGRPRPDSPTR